MSRTRRVTLSVCIGLLAALAGGACSRSRKPAGAGPPGGPVNATPSPEVKVGDFQIVVTRQLFGVKAGPLTRLSIDGAGAFVAMTDPPAQLATAQASASDLTDLRRAVAALDAPGLRWTGESAGGGPMQVWFHITDGTGTRSKKIEGPTPAHLQPIMALLDRLEKAATAQPVPALDSATVTFQRQLHGAGLGPAETIRVNVGAGRAELETSEGKTGSVEVYPAELTRLHMALMDPALAAVQSTQAMSEGMHRTLIIKLGEVTRELHFDGGVPATAEPLVKLLNALLDRALAAP